MSYASWVEFGSTENNDKRIRIMNDRTLRGFIGLIKTDKVVRFTVNPTFLTLSFMKSLSA